MQNNQKKQKTSWIYIVLLALLLLISALMIYMFLWAMITSLKSNDDMIYGNPIGFPNLDESDPNNSRLQFFHFKNYATVFREIKIAWTEIYYKGSTLVTHQTNTLFGWMYNFSDPFEYERAYLPDMLVNTLLYAGIGGLILAAVPALTAYLCSKYDFKVSKILFMVYTVIMCIPIVGNFPSELTFLRNAGLFDSFLGNFLQKMSGGGMYFFIYYAFFGTLPNTYREAAEIDGASELTIMCRIYFPLARTMVATVFLLQFVALWNDYQGVLLYLPTHPTLAYGVYELTTSTTEPALANTPAQMTGCMMLAIPLIILFVLFKDKLMGNLSLGGLKE